MPNQDQTGPNGQGTCTASGQGRCRSFSQPSADQEPSLFGALRNRFRAGQQGQGKGRGNGRNNGAGFRGGCRR